MKSETFDDIIGRVREVGDLTSWGVADYLMTLTPQEKTKIGRAGPEKSALGEPASKVFKKEEGLD